ncbi:MAG: hypothetical protein ABWZ98_01735 [Nakamurella sp.]
MNSKSRTLQRQLAKNKRRRPVDTWPSQEPEGSTWLFGRRAGLAFIVVGLIVAGFILWPRVSLLFSPARPIVDTLSQDVLWVDPDVPAGSVDTDRIRGIIGQRPLAVIVLAVDNDSFDSSLDACTAVTSRIDDLTVMVVQDGALANGCQGDDVPITGNEFGYDFVFWQMMDSQTTFLHGDIPAQVQQLALFYDTNVSNGQLEPRTRTFGAPAGQWALAVGLVFAVTAGVVLLFFGLRRGIVALQKRQARRRQWRAQRDDLDAQLQDIAMIMLAAEPANGSTPNGSIRAVAATSAGYISALDELTDSRPGDDLTPLRQRIQAIRRRLPADTRAGGR